VSSRNAREAGCVISPEVFDLKRTALFLVLALAACSNAGGTTQVAPPTSPFLAAKVKTLVPIGPPFQNPYAVAVDAEGNVYVSDDRRNSLAKIAPSGRVEDFGQNVRLANEIAFDRRGNVYVVASVESRVYKLAKNGSLTAMIPSGCTIPTGVAVDAADNIYVSCGGDGELKKIAPDGAVSVLARGFVGNKGIAIDPNGNVYLADAVHDAVAKIAPNGQVTANVGGGFNRPSDVALAPDGTIYVADKGNNRIAQIVRGQTSTFASGVLDPRGVAVSSAGTVFATDTGRGIVVKLPAGEKKVSVATANNARGVAVDEQGNVYIADTGNDAVKKVAIDGTITRIGSGFKTPIGVAVDEDGNVYVSDTGHNQVKKIAPDGTITQVGSGYDHPYGVAVDNRGTVFVADFGHDQIARIDTAGQVKRFYTGSSRDGEPSGVAISPNGDRLTIAIYQKSDARIGHLIQVDRDGNFIAYVGKYGPDPFGVAVDAAGDVYASYAEIGQKHQVLRFDPPFDYSTEGTVTQTIPFTFPIGVAIARNCNGAPIAACYLYVTDPAEGKVFRITPE
jgi:large repetitive protein